MGKSIVYYRNRYYECSDVWTRRNLSGAQAGDKIVVGHTQYLILAKLSSEWLFGKDILGGGLYTIGNPICFRNTTGIKDTLTSQSFLMAAYKRMHHLYLWLDEFDYDC